MEQIRIKPLEPIDTPYLNLTKAGVLTIKAGFAWDGPSGPTVDTKNFMRGSLVHDALFQMMRMELLGEEHFSDANLELRRICREDGMSRVRSWYVWRSVEKFAAGAAEQGTAKPVLTAP